MEYYEDTKKYFTESALKYIKKEINNSKGNEILFGCYLDLPVSKNEQCSKENYYDENQFISNKNSIEIEEIDNIFYYKKNLNNVPLNENDESNDESIENNRIYDLKLISKVELIFRGNSDSVIIDENIVQKYDLIIHNHPSGNLSPSNADQYFANFCKENGIGFSIINNKVTRIYFIVPFITVHKLLNISEDDVKYLLSSKNDKIKKILPDFTERVNQIKMAVEITRSLNNCKNIILEAGTGIGKSLAYLIPAILYSLKNNVKVVVSTNTIALQEQLFYKDLSIVQKIIDKNINYKILLGRRNYICKLKYEIFKSHHNDSLFEDKLKKEFEEVSEFLKKNQSGMFTDFSFKISNELKKEINTDSETCLKNRCKFYSTCFYYKGRKEITKADLIIVNHSLYFTSAKNPQGNILPGHKVLIFDEAHNIEDVIDKSLINIFNLNLFLKNIDKFFNKKEKKGYLTLILKNFDFSNDNFKIQNIKDKISDQISNIHNYFNNLLLFLDQIVKCISEDNNNSFNQNNNLNYKKSSLIYFNNKEKNEKVIYNSSKKDFLNTTEIIFNKFIKFFDSNQKKEFNVLLNNIIYEMEELEKILGVILNKIDESKEAELNNTQLFTKYYLINFISNISDHINILNKFIIDQNIISEIWIKITSKNVIFSFYDSSLKRDLLTSIMEKVNSTIFTSATLAINKSFDFFKNQLFINYNIFTELILNSPYNYKENSKIYIPKDIVEPGDRDFINSIKQKILNLILLNNGNTVILTTSYHDMNILFNYLSDKLKENKINLYMQGYLYPKKKLIELFKTNKNSVLIGTSTFWEGIDIPGESLSLLIITKLPFKVPSNPLVQIKSEYIEKLNKNKFMNFLLPNAVLKLKQGYGRLIRKENDKGACFIFDKRIKIKQYGNLMINSLPEIDIMYDNFNKLEDDYKKQFIF